MKIEVIVPEGTRMSYTVDATVQEIVFHIKAHAHLTVMHIPHETSCIKQRYVLCASAHLMLHGWYEHALNLDLQVILLGADASADMRCGIKGKAQAQTTITSMQRHEAPHTQSNLVCKGVLADRAHMMHTGLIHIAAEAVDTKASLRSNHMLLSPYALARIQPNLEILTDRVQCSHASAIGAFDTYMLFYMQTRGIEPSHAGQVLEEAFLAEVRL